MPANRRSTGALGIASRVLPGARRRDREARVRRRLDAIRCKGAPGCPAA